MPVVLVLHSTSFKTAPCTFPKLLPIERGRIYIGVTPWCLSGLFPVRVYGIIDSRASLGPSTCSGNCMCLDKCDLALLAFLRVMLRSNFAGEIPPVLHKFGLAPFVLGNAPWSLLRLLSASRLACLSLTRSSFRFKLGHPPL